MINNRQNGRRRGRGGGQRAPGGGGQGGQRDSGNRIDSRARGNASQLHEKYKNMAADAQRQGDRVTTEYYLQFADHYFRVMADQRGRYEDQQQRRPSNDFDGDEEYGDEGEPIRADEQIRGDRGDQEQREFARRDRAPREQNAGRAQRGDEGREVRDGGRRDRAPRDGGFEAERREDRGRERSREEQAETPRQPAPRPAYANDEQATPDAVAAPDPAAPKRRGRPRKVVAEEATGLDASALPPSLGIAPASADDEAPAPKPRRRRAAGTGEASQAS